jgi:glutathione S-transferase
MRTLYGSPMSSAGRSRWMLEEVGVPYEHVVVNLRDEAARATFTAINPAGKIPFLIDGDVRLGESIAINFYLAERYAPAMWSSDPVERARIYEWSLWAITNVQPESLRVMRHTAMLPEVDRRPDEAAAGTREVKRYLEYLEAQLGGDFLVGGRLTVADVNVASVANLALRMGLPGAGPRTTAWMERLRARPAYQRATAG